MNEILHLPLSQGQVWYQASFLSILESIALFEEVIELPWKQEPIMMFGKQVMQPRLTCWVGLPEAKIRYSGIEMLPTPYTPKMFALNNRLATLLEVPFNGVLLNWYRDGQDSMGWHADDESYQGPEPTIASISLGATRRFDLKSKTDDKETYHLPLENGSLLVMAGSTQNHYKHQIPKSKTVVGPRINLTFRRILY
jgi:alkylated DNA repair dioxygenase AlkB